MYILKGKEKVLNKYLFFTPEQYILFEKLYSMIVDTPINLTRITAKDDFYLKHILDSIYFIKYLDADFQTGIDVGTGGGFPGIILAIYFRNKNFYLVDSVKKKCDFVAKFIAELGLKNAYVINSRVENIKDIKADIIFSRGVGKAEEILRLTKNVSHETTAYLFYKGENIDSEINTAIKYIKKRGLIYDNVRVQEPILRSYLYFNSANYIRLRRKKNID
jgi:16S rRNA (guanine527-N7)-methyltransferase